MKQTSKNILQIFYCLKKYIFSPVADVIRLACDVKLARWFDGLPELPLRSHLVTGANVGHARTGTWSPDTRKTFADTVVHWCSCVHAHIYNFYFSQNQ